MGAGRGLVALLAKLGLRQTIAPAAPEAPPARWLRYAEAASRIVPPWLDEPTPAVTLLRDALEDLVAERRETLVLPLSLWLAPDGTISRAVLADGRMTDAGAVFEGRRLPAPPADLRWPMRLQLRVSPGGIGEAT